MVVLKKNICSFLLLFFSFFLFAEKDISLTGKLRPATTKLSSKIIFSNLHHPWGMDFLPNGDIIITEKRGNLFIFQKNEKKSSQKWFKKKVNGLPKKIKQYGQGGLLDVIFDPQFKKNNFIYFSFAEQKKGKYSTAVMRAKLVVKGKQYFLSQKKIIFSVAQKNTTGRHFGSRLVFDKKGKLFITIGDHGDSPRAQNKRDAAGSVVRINTDGSIPKDNPFIDDKNYLPSLWSIGHRNAQGAALHPVTEELWTLSHGARGGDEINIARAGKNYGWPIISYGRHYWGGKIGQGYKGKGYEQPIYYWDPSIAPSGLAFYDGKNLKIKSWRQEGRQNLLVGALKYKMLVRLVIEKNRIVAEEHYLKNRFGRIRDVNVGLDGAIWILTDERDGKVIRIY